MKKILITLILTSSSLLMSYQKYNPYQQRWETVPSDSEIKYNPYSQSWSYQPPDAQVEYNPYHNKWDWNSGINY